LQLSRGKGDLCISDKYGIPLFFPSLPRRGCRGGYKLPLVKGAGGILSLSCNPIKTNPTYILLLVRGGIFWLQRYAKL
jgi:hypothetical protein